MKVWHTLADGQSRPDGRSSFFNGRVIYCSDGWFARLRADDAEHLAGKNVIFRLVDGEGLLVGPFHDRRRLDRWVDAFIAMHGTNRTLPGQLPDLALSKYRPCPRDHPLTRISASAGLG
jgi:hypothetical protein